MFLFNVVMVDEIVVSPDCFEAWIQCDLKPDPGRRRRRRCGPRLCEM